MKILITIAAALIGLTAAPFTQLCFGKATHLSNSYIIAAKVRTKISDFSFFVANTDTAMMTSHFIVGEAPSGSVNGVNKVFTLLHAPLKGKEAVYLNGVLQVRGTNYTISTTTITMTTAPFAGDLIRVIYYY